MLKFTFGDIHQFNIENHPKSPLEDMNIMSFLKSSKDTYSKLI